jgi:hypothetical protein
LVLNYKFNTSFVQACATGISQTTMKHKVALKITFLLSAKLLFYEPWFEIAHAYRTVSWFRAYFAL